MYCGQDFDVIQPNETDVFVIDFVNDVATGDSIETATALLYVAQTSLGCDTDPMSHLPGNATVSGTQVSVQLGGLLDGVLYGLEITVVTAAGNTIALYSHIPCRDIDSTPVPGP